MAGRLLCLNAALPGGTFLTAQLLRPRWIRHLPVTFGALSKQRVPDDLFRSWIHPLRHNPRVRRDLPPQRPQTPAVARVDRPAAHLRRTGPHHLGTRRQTHAPTHAERLTEHFQNTQLMWIDDTRTLFPVDQPKTLTNHLHTFLAAHT